MAGPDKSGRIQRSRRFRIMDAVVSTGMAFGLGWLVLEQLDWGAIIACVLVLGGALYGTVLFTYLALLQSQRKQDTSQESA